MAGIMIRTQSVQSTKTMKNKIDISLKACLFKVTKLGTGGPSEDSHVAIMAGTMQ